MFVDAAKLRVNFAVEPDNLRDCNQSLPYNVPEYFPSPYFLTIFVDSIALVAASLRPTIH